jgi:hypothetical protein
MADQPTPYPGGPEYPDDDDARSPWLYVLITVLVLVAVGLVAWLVLGGDNGEGDEEPTPTPSVSTTTASPTTSSASPTTTSASPSETALEGFSTDPVTEGGFPELGDDIGYGTAVRVGNQEGYDRVVFEFSGSGTPSYQVQYTDSPTDQGSGDPVDVAGDAALQVTITSVGVPTGTSTPTMTTPDTAGTVFAQVEGIWGGFEGYGETFVGIDGGQRPFHVEVLQDPMRLVVDVATG